MEKLTAITIIIVASVIGMIFLTWPKEPKLCEPFVKITSPHSYEYSCFEKDMPLVFEGNASIDCRDVSNQIMWKSNKDGELNVGKRFTASLSPGRHTITAQIDDRAKNSISVIVDKNIVKKATQKIDTIKIKDMDGDIFIVDRIKGVITDTNKGLMWQRKPEVYQYNYEEAVDHAKNSKLAGYSNWRLPTQRELADIHNIYYDKRNALLHSEFSTFEGKFLSSTLVQTEAGYKFWGGVQQSSSITAGLFHSSLVNIALNAKVYVRLVRNI